MEVLVICPPERTLELGPLPEGFHVVPGIEEAPDRNYSALLDLAFEENTGRTEFLQNWPGAVVIVSAPALTCSQLPPGFVRINGWPGFLGSLVEACTADAAAATAAEAVLARWGKKPEWVPDVPGMIAPRIILSIINEAYFTLSEGIATREAIDTAMKLGTAYPFGPFQWAQRIGMHRVVGLLQLLARTESRYEPCTLLVKEAAEATIATQ